MSASRKLSELTLLALVACVGTPIGCKAIAPYSKARASDAAEGSDMRMDGIEQLDGSFADGTRDAEQDLDLRDEGPQLDLDQRDEGPQLDLDPPPAITLPISIGVIDGWHWVNPLPFGDPPTAAWVQGAEVLVGVASSKSDVGMLLRAGPTAWVTTRGSVDKIHGLWGRSPTQLFAATSGGLRTFDGSSWVGTRQLYTISLAGVSGRRDNDELFAVGGTRAYHHSASAWDQGHDAGVPLAGVWCCRGSNAYAVGEAGTILGWTGSSWQQETTGTSADLKAVWGASSGELFAVGTGGVALRQLTAGGSWEALSSGSANALSTIWGVSATEVYAAGEDTFIRFDGTSWTPEPDAPSVASWLHLVGDGAHLVAVARNGAIAQYRSGRWSFGQPTSLQDQSLYSVWSDGTTAFASDTRGNILQRIGSTWEVVHTLPQVGTAWLWGSSGTQVFAAGRGGAVHRFDGTQWNAGSVGSAATLNAVHGCGPSEVYVGGASGIWQSNGTSWTPIFGETTTVEALHCVQGKLFAGLLTGSIIRRVASTSWVLEEDLGSPVWGLWASSSTDVWAVGHTGQVAHRDASGWQRLSLPTPETWLAAVWGTGPSNVYIVGPRGAIYHFDGSAFARQGPLTTHTLRSVWGSSGSEVLAVGDGTTILHRMP